MLGELSVTRDAILTELRECERQIAAVRARQVVLLRRLTRAEWDEPRPDELAAELDLAPRTARDLVETARRTPELSPAMSRLRAGDWSFDRASAMAALVGVGADEETLAEAESHDVAGVHRLRGLQKRITRRSEHEAHAQRSVRCWASLDEAAGYIHAELAGYDWRVVTTALDDRSDRLPHDESATADQRRADALVALAQDWLAGRVEPNGPAPAGGVVTVMVDPRLAAATDGEAGAQISAGPRIGPETLDRIMCEGSVEIVLSADSGVPLAVGPSTRVVPPKLRRFIINRDDGCVIAGCTSGYRLQVHHIVPRSEGGTHEPENLVTLCWWHHHVAIHGQGQRIDPESPPHRRRLLPARGRSP